MPENVVHLYDYRVKKFRAKFCKVCPSYIDGMCFEDEEEECPQYLTEGWVPLGPTITEMSVALISTQD